MKIAPAAFRSFKIPFHKNPSMSWACVVSILLFLLFCGLQAAGSSVLSLPVQWLGISVLPILLALIVGDYVGKFKAAGIEFEPGMRRLPYVPPAPTPLHEPGTHAASEGLSAGSAWQDQLALEYLRTDNLFLAHVYERST